MTPLVLRPFSQASRCCLEVSSKASCIRPFSSTWRKAAGYLPSFEPTSSPELDNLLAEMRTKVFIPSQLSNVQRALVFKTTQQHKLRQSPISVQIGDEEVRLQPIQRKELIRIRPTLREAVRLMKEPGDIRQLPKVLEGLVAAGVRCTPEAMLQMARKANLMGRQDVILRCASAVKRTGFSLGNGEVADEAILGAHMMAAQSDWSKDALDLALQNATSLVQMMDMPLHQPQKGEFPVKSNARPQIIGVFMELTAMRALRYQDQQDLDGAVQDFATKFIATFENFEWAEDNLAMFVHERILQRWLPAWNGLKMALQIRGLNDPLIEQLNASRTLLDQKIESAREIVTLAAKNWKNPPKERQSLIRDEGASVTRGLEMYDTLSNMSA